MIDPNNLPEFPELMIVGPGELDEDDLAALGHQVIAHYGDIWTQLHNETLDNLATLFGASQRPYLVPGSGTASLEMAMLNLFESGQTIVIADTGFFGTRLIEIATSLGLEVVVVDVEVGAPADPRAIEKAAKGAHGIATVHVDTSTGVRHPIEEIAQVAKRNGISYVVDGIASAGGETVDIERMGLDAFVTSTQKGLEAPPGLGVIALSEIGKERVAARTAPVRSWYFDLNRWDQYRSEWGAWHPHPVTMPTNLLLALASSLKRILAVGANKWIESRAELSTYCRDQLDSLGLKSVAVSGYGANLVVAVYADDAAGIQKHLLSNGIMISGGLGSMKDKAIRVGLMGRTANRESVDRLMKLIGDHLGSM